jgi:hypothetical protein
MWVAAHGVLLVDSLIVGLGQPMRLEQNVRSPTRARGCGIKNGNQIRVRVRVRSARDVRCLDNRAYHVDLQILRTKSQKTKAGQCQSQ